VSPSGKRLFDLVAAVPLLAVAALPLLVAAVAIRATMGPPVLFRHRRIGRGGRPFTLLKLRTMRAGAPGEPDEDRLTPLGRRLRALSLDEIPQLWNVVRGDMSLVGPRPLLPQYLERYTPEQARRHEVPPGITGLAQVEGRNALGWDEKFRLDVWYVDHRSFALDLRILARTVLAVSSGRGVSAAGHATMPEFMGTASARSGGGVLEGERR
jgi:lipopolysaccharide/colanic/teichoic acid biosynthesis glycosyltransferase